MTKFSKIRQGDRVVSTKKSKGPTIERSGLHVQRINTHAANAKERRYFEKLQRVEKALSDGNASFGAVVKGGIEMSGATADFRKMLCTRSPWIVHLAGGKSVLFNAHAIAEGHDGKLIIKGDVIPSMSKTKLMDAKVDPAGHGSQLRASPLLIKYK